MADQSLEDIATQLEAALAAETGTTVPPGTISPVGVFEPSGKRRLSWPEIIKKIQEGVGLAETDILPNIPGGFAAPAFFRAGVSSGFLPSGATTFTQAPFTEGFANRMAIAQGLVPATTATTEPAATSAVSTTPTASQQGGFARTATAANQPTDADEHDLKYGTGAPGPATIPGKKISFLEFLATALLPFGGGGAALGTLGSDLKAYMSGETDLFMDLSTAEPELIQGWYNRGEFGDLNTERGRKQADNVLRLYATGERHFTFGGELADPLTGRKYNPDDLMDRDEAYYMKMLEEGDDQKQKKKWPWEIFIEDMFGDGEETGISSRTFKEGYNKDGTYTNKFGKVTAMGDWYVFEDLIRTNPELAHQVIQARGRGGFFGIDPVLYDRTKAAYAQWLANNKTSDDSGKDTTTTGGKPKQIWDRLDEQLPFGDIPGQMPTHPTRHSTDGYSPTPVWAPFLDPTYRHEQGLIAAQRQAGVDAMRLDSEKAASERGFYEWPYESESKEAKDALERYNNWLSTPGINARDTEDREDREGTGDPADDRFQDAVSTGRNLGLDIGTGRRADPWATARGPQAVDVPGTTPEAFPPEYYGGTVDPGSGAIPGVLTSSVGPREGITAAEASRRQQIAGASTITPTPIGETRSLVQNYPDVMAQRIAYQRDLLANQRLSRAPSFFTYPEGQSSAQQAIDKASLGTSDWDDFYGRPDDITSAPPVKQHATLPNVSVIDAARIAKTQAMTYPPADTGDQTIHDPAGTATTGYEDMGLDDFYGEDQGYHGGDTGYEGGFSAWQSGGQIGMQEGGMPMPPQQGGMAPPMQQPQAPAQGVDTDIANLGLVSDQGAAQPQNGGEQSVQDDVAMQANEGDYILPYETVLLTGLNQLNRYAREAIQLAMENNISLQGTDLDPTDDVPIKVSNYEYHIPKVLVPFFGGGKKYLDKIREEGLALRSRLEEEKEPSMQEQQPMPQEQQLASAAAPPEPQMPMMQTGGFVTDPNEGLQPTPTTEAVLEGDISQQTTAYNQLQALKRAEKTQQQPPMVDPTGKVVPQGFAAPQGYFDGGGVDPKHAAVLREQEKETLRGLKDFQQLAFLGNLESSNLEEQIAYMWTVPNRMEHKSFPNKASDVIFQDNAYSPLKHMASEARAKNWERGVSAVKFGDDKFAELQKISKDILGKRAVDPTFGAIYAINQKQYNLYQRDKEKGTPGYVAKAIPDHLNNAILKAKGLPEVYKTVTIGKTDFYAEKPKKQKVAVESGSEYTPPPEEETMRQEQTHYEDTLSTAGINPDEYQGAMM